jgi:hypothetical protein
MLKSHYSSCGPKFKVVSGEVSAYDPVLTRFGPLFFFESIQVAIYLTLLFATLTAAHTFDTRWYGEFCRWWMVVYAVFSLLLWTVYPNWIKSCRVLTRDEKKKTSLIIGRPMYLSLQKGIMASLIIFTTIIIAMWNLLGLEPMFKTHMDHAATVSVMQILITMSLLGCAAMVSSIYDQVCPSANVQDVAICIPNINQ